MKIEGGCYCGEVRYSFEGEPGPAMQCHCRECQYITGGNPNVFVMIPEAELHFTGGPELIPAYRYRQSGDTTLLPELRHCGGYNNTGAPGVFVMKVGTMDNADFFQPDMAIFTKDAKSFHHIPDGLPSFEELPTGF